jgi:hypothetical protein
MKGLRKALSSKASLRCVKQHRTPEYEVVHSIQKSAWMDCESSGDICNVIRSEILDFGSVSLGAR